MKSIAHIGIAVKDLDASVERFRTLLGKDPAQREVVSDQNVSTALFETGPSGIELLQATSADSPVARFIERRGEGIHHVCFEVDDIRAELSRLGKQGFQLIDKEPRLGAGGYLVAFLHPASTNGVLIELGQKPAPGHGG